MKNGSIGIDTNVLVHAFSADCPRKHAVARKLIHNVLAGKVSAAIPSQVLAEFTCVMRHKAKRPIPGEHVRSIVRLFIECPFCDILSYTADHVLAAAQRDGPFWDGLIAQTLLHHGVRDILTENTKDFAGTGMRAKNPFA